jgi:glycosyltransferase involved in cell wall biosynthesis
MKLCFLSLNSYPTLTEKNLGYAGGAEVEQVHLAKELVRRGYTVCFVTYYYGRSQIENIDGIDIIKTYDRQKSSDVSVLSKYSSIWSALKKADANIYFHEAGSTGILPVFCYINGKKFVYRIPSDAVVLERSLSGNYRFNKKLADLLEIKRADVVIAQSKFQQRILKNRFKVESCVIKNGLILPIVNSEKPVPPVVLWVGSISTVKNPELFVKLAKSLPNLRFEMVGGRGEPFQLYDEIAAAAEKLPNFKFHGFVPYNKVNEYFWKTSIFVNTSSIEGFPNTFIQAWANNAPVVSLKVDPDHIIQNEKLGFCSGTFEQLSSDVTSLLENEALRKIMGENGRRYVEREHDIREVVKSYVAIFANLLESDREKITLDIAKGKKPLGLKNLISPV